VPLSDQKLLGTVMPRIAKLSTGSLNYAWAEAWVRDMKRIDHLAPARFASARACLPGVSIG
jgi:hypothetical protein